MENKHVALRYIDYRNAVSKIGFEEAQATFARNMAELGDQGWQLQLLCEFHNMQYAIVTTQNDLSRTSTIIRTHIRLLAHEPFLQKHAVHVPVLLDQFDTLENLRGELQYVFDGFLFLHTRCEIIRCLVRHDAINVPEILNVLLQCARRLPSRYLIHLSDMIYTLVEEIPSYAGTVRFKLAEMRLLPELITRLTVMYCSDEVDFLNGVFRGMPTWFLAQSSTSSIHFMKIKQRIFQDMEQSMADIELHQVKVATGIRALAGLIGYFGLKLHDSEAAIFLNLLRVSRTERLTNLLLSLMLLISDQILRQQRDITIVLTDLLQSAVSEMPMLLLMYFQTDQIGQIENLVRSVLSMQVAIPKLGLFEVQKLFRSIQQRSHTAGK